MEPELFDRNRLCLPEDSYHGMNSVMGTPAAKLSVSVPGELAEAVRKRVGAKGLSGFVARALAHELEREGVGALLVELEERLGPPSKADLARARKAWPKR